MTRQAGVIAWCIMTNDEVKQAIDSDLEKIIHYLIQEFGNEGADIGDAGNWAELLGNTIPHINAPHNSYEIKDFLDAVAVTAGIPRTDLQRLYDEIQTWDSTKFNEEGAWVGFNG